jgi:AcrR family transcriptional regulator
VTTDATAELVDRAALVRRALRALVAERGFHGASMSAVAQAAGVATGTAYTYYASKDALVLAAYRETKAELGAAALAGVSDEMGPAKRFRRIWLAIYHHLAAHRDHARFLLAVDHSPYRAALHAAIVANGDPLGAEAGRPELAAALRPFPLEVLWELGLSPAVRLAAASGEIALDDELLRQIAVACWRAVSR